MFRSEHTERPPGLRLIGELDLSTCPAFASAIGTEARRGGDVVLDMTGLEFIDSTGVSELLSAAQSLEGRGRLVVRGIRPGVRRVFELLGVERAPSLVIAECSRRRQDAGGLLHPVAEARCACGCRYDFATDDFAIFWEAGPRIDPRCADTSCQCHLDPLAG